MALILDVSFFSMGEGSSQSGRLILLALSHSQNPEFPQPCTKLYVYIHMVLLEI